MSRLCLDMKRGRGGTERERRERAVLHKKIKDSAMKPMPKPVFLAAGAYTVSLGPGRREFNPRTPRPGLEHYIRSAGEAVLAQIGDPGLIDEGVIGNFMAARFNHQGHLGSLMTIVHPSLEYKPAMRVEGACASGGLALARASRAC